MKLSDLSNKRFNTKIKANILGLVQFFRRVLGIQVEHGAEFAIVIVSHSGDIIDSNIKFSKKEKREIEEWSKSVKYHTIIEDGHYRLLLDRKFYIFKEVLFEDCNVLIGKFFELDMKTRIHIMDTQIINILRILPEWTQDR